MQTLVQQEGATAVESLRESLPESFVSGRPMTYCFHIPRLLNGKCAALLVFCIHACCMETNFHLKRSSAGERKIVFETGTETGTERRERESLPNYIFICFILFSLKDSSPEMSLFKLKICVF